MAADSSLQGPTGTRERVELSPWPLRCPKAPGSRRNNRRLREVTCLTQGSQPGALLTPFSATLNPGAGAGAGEKAACWPACRLPESSGYLWGQPWHAPRSRCCGAPLGAPGAGRWPSLPQRPSPVQLPGAALAERPPACAELPKGVPGKPPPHACSKVHQGGGFPSGLILQGHGGQASGHPPAGTGSFALVWSGGWPGPGG